MIKNIRALFFDNDGVLVDTERLYFAATCRVLEAAGVSLTREQYIQSILIDGKGAWHLAAQKGVDAKGIERLRRERNAIYDSLLRKEQILIDGVQSVLELLIGKFSMAIVTSSLPDHFETIHERTGFLKYFEFVITAKDFSRSKPDPEPYLIALERSGFQADECMVIEDSERGLASATAAGLKCIVIPNELTRECGFAGAHKILGHISELLHVLR